jgi:hypothetical protein
MKRFPVLFTVVIMLLSSVDSRADSSLTNGTASNISNRALSGSGDNASICGFVVKNAATFLLIRAVGPGLAKFGVIGYATGTSFDVVDANGITVTSGGAFADYTPVEQANINTKYLALGAFPLPTNSADSFTYLCLNPGNYTVVARSTGSSPGIILTEIYFDSAGIGALEPLSFDSTVAATNYANQLFALGKVDILGAQQDVLVLQTFGSGVPLISIGIYRYTSGRWQLASEWQPRDYQRFYTIKEENGNVVAVGNITGEKWVLLTL